MSRLAALSSACVLAFAWAGSAQAQSAKAGIEAVIADFEAAFNGKDAAAEAELFSANAVFFPPEALPIDGRVEIDNCGRGGIDAGLSEAQSKSTTAAMPPVTSGHFR
jgi:ketosteroid isomerase-like protein